jgi:hypothetical protein
MFGDDMHGCSGLARPSGHMQNNPPRFLTQVSFYLVSSYTLVRKKSVLWRMRLQCRLFLNLFSLWGIEIEEVEEESLPRRPFVYSCLL